MFFARNYNNLKGESSILSENTRGFFFLFHTLSRTVVSHFVSAYSNEMTLSKRQKTFSLLAPGRFGERCSLERTPTSSSGNFPTLNTPPTVSLERLFRLSRGRRFLLIYLFDDWNRYWH